MARLETQINQVYLSDPQIKKNSLILYEEQLTNSLQLFVVAELTNIQKKSESNDLKKISEIILASFRTNKKLPAEILFETSLSTVNQNLADLAHEGRKSWVGKFSCLICIKALDNTIYLANNGQTKAFLIRNKLVNEILPSEKRGMHPLKSFVNFTQGKLNDEDILVLTTANIFDYVSLELFSKIFIQKPLNEATEEVMAILKDSMSTETAFASFLMKFTKKPIEEQTIAQKENIYAPLPEELDTTPSEIPEAAKSKFSFQKINFKFPSPSFAWFNKFKVIDYFKKLTKPGKFFFISFSIFLVLFLVNLGIYASKINEKKAAARVTVLVEQINNELAQIQSALIYKNEKQALEHLNNAINGITELTQLDPAKASELNAKVEQVKTVINKINTVAQPSVFFELKHDPVYLTNTSIGFLLSNEDSNSLSLLANNNLTDYFLLNSLKNPISSLNYFPPTGVVVSSTNEIYKIDENLKQFELILTLPVINIRQTKFANNNLYVLSEGTITRIISRSGRLTPQPAVNGDFTLARDFGVDRDFWVLFPEKIVKYVSGQAQAFPLPNMTEPMTNADKIFVASNLYILEANKKRLIILGKNGALINQIYFPSTNTPTDFHVDEAGRQIYLLDDNKLFKITF